MTLTKKTLGTRRHRARTVVLSALYAYYTTGSDAHQVFAGVREKEQLTGDAAGFAERLFSAAIAHAAEIDQLIGKAAANWSFERIAFVDKNILRLGIAELLYLLDTPPKTAMNEAIELAREYSSEESSKFVNGILDTVYHKSLSQGH